MVMHESPPNHPPGASPALRKAALRVVRPLERFLHIEASSGLLLLAATAVALFWANSPWFRSYEHLWHTPITLGIGGWSFSRDLHFWISDGAMTIFFLVVGLEIRREMDEGELSEWRRAALPIAGALGGMLVPALLYFAMNASGPGRHGWGVPMATDIAFAVGILALLGKRVPAALRVFLLALAVIDDIGAILVIAIFYSARINTLGLGLAGGGLLLVFLFQRLGIRRALLYAFPGIVVWSGLLIAGVHPTLAGVVLGLATPARSWFGAQGFFQAATEVLEKMRDRPEGDPHELSRSLQRLGTARREAMAPVVRLIVHLHPWVAYGVMPLFALANAGVRVEGVSLTESTSLMVLVGVGVGLLVGKPLGILAVSWIAARSGLCRLPRGMTFRQLTVAGLLGGVGFTMAIFIAVLAFQDEALLGAAKLGVLAGSVTAGVLGLLAGRILLVPQADLSHLSADDVEAMTDY